MLCHIYESLLISRHLQHSKGVGVVHVLLFEWLFLLLLNRWTYSIGGQARSDALAQKLSHRLTYETVLLVRENCHSCFARPRARCDGEGTPPNF